MRRQIVALIVAAAGFAVAVWGISTLAYYRSFTETTEGVVKSRTEHGIILRFYEERSSPQVQFSGYQEHEFPINQWTGKLNVGDKVTVYHPPGKLHDARFEKDFSYLLPCGVAAAGVILILIAAAILVRLQRMSHEHS